MALTVGELVGYLRIDSSAWRRGLADARAQLARMARESSVDLEKLANKAEKAGDRAAKALVGLSLGITKVAAAAAAARGVAGVFTGLGGALAVLPAAGVAVGVGMAAARVGVAGFGDAIKNAGDPEKFAESLERLSPAAQETAVAVRDLGSAWRSVQRATQDALFAGVADDVRVLGGLYLPVLETGLSGIAAEFNSAARGTAAFLGQSRQVQTVTSLFGNVRASIGDVSGAVPPLVSILLDLVAVGSEFLPGLAGGFATAALRAAEFVRQARETGQLHEWIASGLATLRQLGELFSNVGAIVGTVLGALDSSGAGLLDTLVRLTGQARAFLESVEGQEALAALGALFATVSSVVTDVLLTALRQLAPVVIALAPGFAELATQVGSILVSALTAAGPLLVSLAGFLSDNVYWLGPLAISLYAGVQAFQAATTALRVLGLATAANPWALLIAATVALVTLIVTNWDTIVSFVRDRVRDVLDFIGWLGSLPGKVAEWFGGIVRAAGDRLAELVRFFRDLPGNLLRALGNLGELLVNAGRDIILGLLRGLRDFAGKIWDWIKGIAQRVWDAIVDFFSIGSPSKKMQWAGRMIGLGLATGLDGMTGTVTTAAEQLAQASAVTLPAPAPPPVRAPAGLGSAAPPTTTPDTEPGSAIGSDGRRAMVHIEQFHATPDQSPHEIATELDWLSRTGG